MSDLQSKSADRDEANSSSGQTPIEPGSRKTGAENQTNADPNAQPETGSSETGVAGSPNQGTEKR